MSEEKKQPNWLEVMRADAAKMAEIEKPKSEDGTVLEEGGHRWLNDLLDENARLRKKLDDQFVELEQARSERDALHGANVQMSGCYNAHDAEFKKLQNDYRTLESADDRHVGEIRAMESLVEERNAMIASLREELEKSRRRWGSCTTCPWREEMESLKDVVAERNELRKLHAAAVGELSRLTIALLQGSMLKTMRDKLEQKESMNE